MSRVYYKYAHGALIVFDLARPETFESALGWLSDVTEKLFDEKYESIVDTKGALEPNKAMPVVLLANKCDVPMVKIPRNKYSSYVAENGLLAWFETSSKDVTSIAHSVKRLVEYILETDPAFSEIVEA